MSPKIKRGRPLANLKIRSIKGLTPKGFKIDKISKKKIIFKKINVFVLVVLLSITLVSAVTTVSDSKISATGNFSLGEKITFAFGEIIDNIVNGWMRINGDLNVTGDAIFNKDVNITGTLYGGSPVKIGGGMNITTGHVYISAGDLHLDGDLIHDKGNVAFSGGNFSVNNSDLFVNINTNRVGIGTTSPTTLLDVNGSLNISGYYYGDGSLLSNLPNPPNYTHLSNFTDDILWNSSFNSTGDNRWLDDTDTNRSDAEILSVALVYNDTTFILNQNYQNATQVNNSIIAKITQAFIEALGFVTGSHTTDTNRSDADILSVANVYNDTHFDYLKNNADDSTTGRLTSTGFISSVFESATGNLKLQAGAVGDVVLFSSADIDDTDDGKELKIWRNAPEGNNYIRTYITSTENALTHSNTNILFQNAAGKNIQMNSGQHIYLNLGDQAGSDEVRIRDNGGLEVGTIDSNGNAWYRGDLSVGVSSDVLIQANGSSYFNGGNFSVNNTDFYVDVSSGNVGIGTIAPALPLEVRNNDDNLAIFVDSRAQAAGTGGGIAFGGKYNDAGGEAMAGRIGTQKTNGISGNVSFDMVFETQDWEGSITERMILTGDGLVGIGEEFPTKTLDVGGNTHISGELETDNGIIAGGDIILDEAITFAFGEIIDNIVNGWMRITGNLNVTGIVDVDSLSGSYTNGEAAVCVYDNGTLFVRDGGCN